MKRKAKITSCAVLLILIVTSVLFAQDISTECIGTYDSRIVALSYGRSEAFGNWIRDLMAEYEEAVETGDTARVDELETMGIAMQELLHKQVFSIWPIDEILETVEEDLTIVMEEVGVTSLVNIWEVEEEDGIEYIDLSDEIAQLFYPDAETLGIIEEIKKVEPVSIEEVSGCSESCSDCDDCE